MILPKELKELKTKISHTHSLILTLAVCEGAPNQERRIEGGMISYRGDTLPDTNALELGLPKRMVDLDQPLNFIGLHSHLTVLSICPFTVLPQRPLAALSHCNLTVPTDSTHSYCQRSSHSAPTTSTHCSESAGKLALKKIKENGVQRKFVSFTVHSDVENLNRPPYFVGERLALTPAEEVRISTV